MKILIVEDDAGAAEILQKALTAQQYLVELASDGQAGWDLTEVFAYDLILLDVKLPKLDGINFCKQLRAQGDRTPIILLTAQDSSTNKVVGLDAGADDYVVKPYDVDELLARMRALLRRGGAPLSPVLEWNSVCLDPNSCEVTYNEQLLRFTAKEYSLLELFLRNTHRVFSQSALLDRLWSLEEYPTENTVRAHIKSLRRKLKQAGAGADFIETVYGLGYRLKTKESDIKNPEEIEVQGSGKENRSPPEPITVSQTLLPSELSAIWARSKEKYGKRVMALEQAVASWRKGKLDAGLQQAAQQEAHTLKGSLGSFGFLKAERLSCEIEQILQTGTQFNQAQIEHLSKLVEALQQELEKPSVSSAITDPHPMTLKQGSRLLIVGDDPELTPALSSEAVAWGIQVETACNLCQARTAIAHSRPDVILLDLGFPDSKDKGLQLLAELAKARSPIPVMVLTEAEGLSDRREVARLGAQGFLQKPIPPAQVMQQIVQVLQQSGSPSAKLLIVDDDPQLLDVLRGLLEPWGFKLTLLDNTKQFWEILEQTDPDLLILDVEIPNFNGIDLCQVVRNDPHWSNLPILFLSAHTEAEVVNQVFTVGADDFVNKPIVAAELVVRILNRLQRTQTLRQLAQPQV
ncbi:MAG: response regulator [Acaryochloris sp. RU_4_1]|nr:response regulator [Leptolyngbyaceae cyanobacterium SU_3_3]NJM64170.1 response regulator [Acaryochloris sp. RU_4_1]NJR53267.1 response regulator [Acaryochloris sp. CRU_2_0]